MPVFKSSCNGFLQYIGIQIPSIQYLIQIIIILHSTALICEVNDRMQLLSNDGF